MRCSRSRRCRRVCRSPASGSTTPRTPPFWPLVSSKRDLPLIERYTRPEMGVVWSEQRKLDTWLEVELAVVETLSEQGVVPEEDAAAIRDMAAFTVAEVKE